jgi:hypothetical protein
MSREKHGRYDQGQGLPDNTMQPVGSGINVWLNEQVLTAFGDEQGQTLLAEATKYAPKRYEWLLERLTEHGRTDIVEEYHQRIRDDAAQRRIRDKQRELGLWRERLAETDNEQQRVWYRKRIAKCEKYIAEHAK